MSFDPDDGNNPSTRLLGGESVLESLIEDCTNRLQSGEAIDVEELAHLHPEHAERLRRLLPSLRMIAEVGWTSPAPLPLQTGLPPNEVLGTTPSEPFELGDYRVLRVIGRGGMGVVYEAIQVSLNRRVALKVLPFVSALDPLQLRRFQTEALAAAQLHHTNIVPVFSVGCERGVHYYAMQYIEGQTLAALVRDLRRLSGLESPAVEVTTATSSLAEEIASGRLAPESPTSSACGPAGAVQCGSPITDELGAFRPAEDLPVRGQSSSAMFRSTGGTRDRAYFRTMASLGMQAAEALEHAHALGIVHRDIKPANLLVDGRGNLWITDFGLARMQPDSSLTMTGDVIGTLRYMSPEQAMARRAGVDHRSDIYSLGVTLYELLTLRPAFAGEGREELLRQVTMEEPRTPRRFNPAVPVDLETIILKAMAKEPTERYATARELSDDLRRFLDVKPINARRPTIWDRVLKLGRRHAGLVAAAFLVLLLAVGGLVASLILIGRERDATRTALARAMDQERLARYNADEATAQARRAHDSFIWFLQGLTEPLKRMANPDLAHNPDYAAMRWEVVSEAIHAYEGFLLTESDEHQKARTIDTWIHIALLYTVVDDHPRAQDSYRKAIEIAENSAGAPRGGMDYFRIGQTHAHLGMELWDVGQVSESAPHFRAAIAAFSRALELDPKDIATLQSMAWFLSLFQDPLYRDPQRALQSARRLVALTSEREHNRRSFAGGIRPLFTLGLAEYRVGNLDAARGALERSVELREGGDAYEGFVLAMVVARQGDLRRARALHGEAVRWMRTYRYSDFELHALDAEAAALLDSLGQPADPAHRQAVPMATAGEPARRP
jgi:serine/threonine protein kinase